MHFLQEHIRKLALMIRQRHRRLLVQMDKDGTNKQQQSTLSHKKALFEVNPKQ